MVNTFVNFYSGVFVCWPTSTITVTGVMAYVPKLGWDYIYNPNAVQHQPGHLLMFTFGALLVSVCTDLIYQISFMDYIAKEKLATIENDPVTEQFKKSLYSQDLTFDGPALKDLLMKDTPAERLQHMKEFIENLMVVKLDINGVTKLKEEINSSGAMDLFLQLVDKCHNINQILQFDKADWATQLQLCGFSDYQMLAGFTVFLISFAMTFNLRIPYHLFGEEQINSIPKIMIYKAIDNYRQVAFDDTRVIAATLLILSAGASTAVDHILPVPIETTPTILHYLKVCVQSIAWAVKYAVSKGVTVEVGFIIKSVRYLCKVFGHFPFIILLFAMHFGLLRVYYTIILAQPSVYYGVVNTLNVIRLQLYDTFFRAHPNRPRGIFTSLYFTYVIFAICSLILYWVYGPPYGR